MAQKLAYTSAVVIVPPQNLWDQIQTIRKEYDKAYVRWMPHINMIYPFIPNDKFADSVPIIREKLQKFSPFKLVFDHFNYFQHGKNCTLFLEPTTTPANVINTLQASVESLFPYCNEQSTKSEHGFSAHLTVGTFPNTKVKIFIQEFMKTFKPIEFVVKEIYLISRFDDDPFEIRYAVPLAGIITSDAVKILESKPQESFVPVPSKAEEASFKVYVSGLNWTLDVPDMEAVLTDELKLSFDSVVIPKNPDGRNRGFGFISFPSDIERQKAIAALNNYSIKGRNILAKEARE